MSEDWIEIYSTELSHQAEIIKALLTENGLSPVEINKKSSPHMIGEIEIYVRREEVIKAKFLIDKYIQ